MFEGIYCFFELRRVQTDALIASDWRWQCSLTLQTAGLVILHCAEYGAGWKAWQRLATFWATTGVTGCCILLFHTVSPYYFVAVVIFGFCCFCPFVRCVPFLFWLLLLRFQMCVYCFADTLTRSAVYSFMRSCMRQRVCFKSASLFLIVWFRYDFVCLFLTICRPRYFALYVHCFRFAISQGFLIRVFFDSDVTCSFCRFLQIQMFGLQLLPGLL